MITNSKKSRAETKSEAESAELIKLKRIIHINMKILYRKFILYVLNELADKLTESLTKLIKLLTESTESAESERII